MGTTQFELVYDFTSFGLASMMASTIFFWLRMSSISPKYKSALAITGLVTFIAAYHYIRIFNSWVEAYEHKSVEQCETWMKANEWKPCPMDYTGKPFNDAYRYMDWFLTVPLLLVELVLVMKLDDGKTLPTCFKLGSAAALMIVLGYPGETSNKNGKRWLFWALAMLPFIYVVYT